MEIVKFVTIIILFILFFYFPNLTHAGQWLSCCTSGCNYADGQSITIGNTVYYCCNNTWQTSPCCIRSNPTVSITPSSQRGTRGLPRNYTVNVTNNDNSPCGSSTFILNVTSCPSNWNCSLLSNTLTISPGSSKSTIITVTPPLNVQLGTYNFTVKATNNQSSSYYGQRSASYVIDSTLLPCGLFSPDVLLYPPIVSPGGTLNVTVNITCYEWNYTSVRNLTFSLRINNVQWSNCFINGKGLITDFNWNGTEQDVASGSCRRGNRTSNGKWYCYENGICKHEDYRLYVYSNSSNGNVIVNFVCELPKNLTLGRHSLTVGATIYTSEISIKPATTGFFVFSLSLPQIFLYYVNLFKKIFIPLFA